jgi:phosphatidylserine/phosphatidylglycerophosphate/cardiolipin synthase-like enzyme
MSRVIILIISISILALSCIYAPTKQTPGSVNVVDYVTGNWDSATLRYTGTIEQGKTQVLFPQQNQKPELALQALYLSANERIDIAIYSLTHPIIVKAIGDAYKRGVKVRIITDKVQSAGNTQKHAMNDLLTIGIPIKYETHSGLMHIKCSIIDGRIATTGSYNYSKGASEDNDEMFLVINEPWFAQVCQQEFDRMWASPQFVNLGMSY